MSMDPTEIKLLPSQTESEQRSAEPAPVPVVVAAKEPPRQLSDLPKDELEALASDFGLDVTRFKTSQTLVIALHERRQLIAAMDREAMLDVVPLGPATGHGQCG